MHFIFYLLAFVIMTVSGFITYNILLAKIPMLLGVKYNKEEEKQLDQIVKDKIKQLNPWQYLKFVSFLEGVLVKFRSWIIKAGSKTNDMIKRVQEKHEEHKPENNIFSAGYWQELKEKKTSQRKRALRDADLNKILKK